jgi:hypothetical protein
MPKLGLLRGLRLNRWHYIGLVVRRQVKLRLREVQSV